MRRVIGIDIHRTFGEVVFWEDGRLRPAGRIDMTRTALEGFARRLLPSDEVVIEATGNCMAVSRVLSPFVARVVIEDEDENGDAESEVNGSEGVEGVSDSGEPIENELADADELEEGEDGPDEDDLEEDDLS